MVYSIDIHEHGRTEPAWRGLFYAKDVVRLMSATDAGLRREPVELGTRAVQGWSRRGFFNMEKNEYARNQAFVRFGGVITSRVITLLLSYQTKIERVADAHKYLRTATGLEFPFASRSFWVESVGFSSEVYAELDRLVVTASRFGQLPFTELLTNKIRNTGDMTFIDSGGEFAAKWEPAPGIVIDPHVQSGAACVKGTRTTTRVLYGGYDTEDDIAGLAYWYELEEDQVVAAIDWEKRLAAVS